MRFKIADCFYIFAIQFSAAKGREMKHRESEFSLRLFLSMIIIVAWS